MNRFRILCDDIKHAADKSAMAGFRQDWNTQKHWKEDARLRWEMLTGSEKQSAKEFFYSEYKRISGNLRNTR